MLRSFVTLLALAVWLEAAAAVGKRSPASPCVVTSALAVRGLPAVLRDGAWYAAPLTEQDGMSDVEGRAVQFLQPDGASEPLPLVSYDECPSEGLTRLPRRLRAIVVGRLKQVNDRLHDGAFAPLGKPLLRRESMSARHRIRLRRGDLELSSSEKQFIVRRGEAPLLSLPLPMKRGRSGPGRRGCGSPHRGWIAAVYLDEARGVVLLHHMYQGDDACPEPIDDWTAHRLPVAR